MTPVANGVSERHPRQRRHLQLLGGSAKSGPRLPARAAKPPSPYKTLVGATRPASRRGSVMTVATISVNGWDNTDQPLHARPPAPSGGRASTATTPTAFCDDCAQRGDRVGQGCAGAAGVDAGRSAHAGSIDFSNPS